MKLAYIHTFVAGAVAFALFAGCAKKDSTLGGSPSASAKPSLKFSAIPDQNQSKLRESFNALAKHLGGVLGLPVEYVPAADYNASIEMFKNGDIQLAWFGGLTGVQAREAVPGARAIVQGDSDPQFYSYFIAHKDAGLSKSDAFPSSIANLAFTFGAEQSTSGRLMPAFFIQKETGKTPEQFFQKTVSFSGSHDKTCELVESGQFQAGVVNFETYDKRVKEGKTNPETCQVIWQTPRYVDYNFTAHPSLESTHGAGFTDKLAKALIDIKDPALLSAFPRKALIPAKNADYDQIKEVAKQLGFLR